MANAGKIHHNQTFIEITEDGKIWLVQNYFDDDSVLLDMERSKNGDVIDDIFFENMFEEGEDDLYG